MCQKAFGSFFAPLVSARRDDVAWTRGQPAHFQSSNLARRGFCRDCGTPLTWERDGEWVELAIGAFDRPDDLRPVIQMCEGQKLSWFGDLPGLPVRTAQEGTEAAPHYAAVQSNQHPDHDTEAWPP